MAEPVNVGGARHRDRNEDQLGHPVGITLGICQPQGHAPRHAAHEPPLNAELFTQVLDVGDQVSGGIVGQVGPGVAHWWSAAPAATLIELHLDR